MTRNLLLFKIFLVAHIFTAYPSTNNYTVIEDREKPLDFWDESKRIFGTASPQNHIDNYVGKRYDITYTPISFFPDHADKKVGDFSIQYTPGETSRFGFHIDLWNGYRKLNSTSKLKFWIKTENTDSPTKWTVRLVDSQKREATNQLTGMNTYGVWRDMTINLQSFRAEKGFDWSSVSFCEFDATFPIGENIRFDYIRFETPEGIIGITDKTLTQRKTEASVSRSKRIKVAMEEAIKDNSSPLTQVFGLLYLNKDLTRANKILEEILEESERTHDSWNLEITSAICRIYFWFSNRCGSIKGRLNPKTEAKLLETLWNRTVEKNDIHLARQGNTWWMDGSENHDLNAKMCNLVTSRIFMNEPEYKNRIYPDYGFGGGYRYGHAGYYGAGVNPDSRKFGGRANLSDSGRYNAEDHYKEWLIYMKKYIIERAEHGIMLEYASPTYSKHSLNFFELGHTYSGDKEFKEMMADFLTLYWADWAQVTIDGIRGGPKTRNHRTIGGYGNGSELVSFYMGGVGTANPFGFWNMFCDYELPDIIWKMALDRESLGKFIYRSRGIGEEVKCFPRPLGTERGLYCNSDSRLLRYSYVTPDYVLGTQMDHPGAVHSHLSVAGRWHGIIFTQSEKSRIVPYAKTPDLKSFDMEFMLQTVQHEQVLIMQQYRQYFSIHPDWFPMTPISHKDIALWFGNDWDEKREKGGWIFVRKGRAYAAVRPVMWDEEYELENSTRGNDSQINFNAPEATPTVKIKECTYTWDVNKTSIFLEDKYAAIIMEAADQDEFGNLDNFISDILNNPLALYKTVVPGYHVMVYTGCSDNAKEIVFNLGSPQIPIIDGEYLDYASDMTFDSPYIRSRYCSGKVTLSITNESLNLDFTKYK